MHVTNQELIYVMVFAFSVITVAAFLKLGIHNIARTVTARPVHYITGCLVLVGLFGAGMRNLDFEPDMKMMMPEDISGRVVMEKIEESFGGADTIYICVTAKTGTIWDPQVLSTVRSISEDLKQTEFANNVISITSSKSITNNDDMMVVTDMVPEGASLSTPAEATAVKAKVKDNRMLYKYLVSKDEKSTLIVATIQNFIRQGATADGKPAYRIFRDEEICRFIEDNPDAPTLLNIMAKNEHPAVKLTLAGFPYFRYDTQGRMKRDNAIFLGAGLITMLAFLYASFRTLRGMLLPLTIVVLGLIASYGFMGWMHEKITLPILMMGPMLIAIAHNYGTQLIAKYYEDVQEWDGDFGPDSLKLLAGNSIVSIGKPVLISAVTVIIGFLAMMSHPLDALALLGILCAFGIVVSFILTIVLTPAILSMLKVPRMLVEKRHGVLTDRLLESTARFTMRRKAFLLGLVCVIMAGSIAYAFRIKVEADFMNAYPKNDPVMQDARFMSDQFGGYSTLNILLEAAHPAAKDSSDDGPMKNPSILKWMHDLQRFVLAQQDPQTGGKLVGDALSIADHIAYMNSIMQNDPAQERVPDTRELIAQYMLSFESQGGEGMSGLVDFKYNAAQIIFRLPDMNTKRIDALNAVLKQYIAEHPNPEVKISFGGPVEIVNEVDDMIVDGQIWSLGLAFVHIIICYMLFFRSVPAGLLAAVPLFCAVVPVFGMMGLLRIPLDSTTATLTGISIGVGADYTAYFMWRFRERASARQSLETGYQETMISIGKGILYNGLSVVVGFFVFLFSNFVPIRYFGFLISFSILACIVATLTIMPVMIFMTRPRFLLRMPEADAGLLSSFGRMRDILHNRAQVKDPLGEGPYLHDDARNKAENGGSMPLK